MLQSPARRVAELDQSDILAMRLRCEKHAFAPLCAAAIGTQITDPTISHTSHAHSHSGSQPNTIILAFCSFVSLL